MKSIVELVVLMVALLAPQFLLASEIDGDEYGKATSGIAMAGVLTTAYKLWQRRTEGSSDEPIG